MPRTLPLLSLALAALLLSSCGPSLGPTPLPAEGDPSPSPVAATPDPTDLALRADLRPVAEGLGDPVDLVGLPGDPRLLIADQAGRLLLVDLRSAGASPRLVADLSDRLSVGGERGLLGVALHPRFGEPSSTRSVEQRIYLDYTRADDGATVVAVVELALESDGGARLLDAPTPLLVISQPFPNHNGGDLLFLPDGRLLVATGDGGAGGDPGGRAQDPENLLGKLLALDVEALARDPLTRADEQHRDADPSALRIVATGLRNPWRIALDPLAGQLWIADVGQATSEEVSRLDLVDLAPERSSVPNFGWPIIEGDRCAGGGACREPRDYRAPLGVYRHDEGACSVSGGALATDDAGERWFLVADWCDGRIRALPANTPSGADPTVTLQVVAEGYPGIAALVTDHQGGVWALDHGSGRLLELRLVR